MPIVGGPSGTGLDKPQALADLAAELGIADVVRFVPPVSQAELARWYAAATLVAVPSYNESFGLVAAEAQATGTPVVAAAVGGLTTVVRDGRSGLLVRGHRTEDWADALQPGRSTDDALRARLERGALEQARLFSWDATAEAHARGLRPGPQLVAARRVVTEPADAAPRLPRRQRPRVRRAAARPVLVRPPRREEAADAGPARRRRARPRPSTPSSAAGPTRTTSGSTSGCCRSNLRLFGVAFAVDRLGDIYLDGRLPLSVRRPRTSSTGCSARC